MIKLVSIGVVACSFLFSGINAMADQKCRDVNIKVKNAYGKKILVTKINYRDKEDKKWRDNDLKNTEIAKGKTKTIEETLEYVGNESIPKMQVQFRYKEDDDDWSDRVWSNVVTGLGGNPCERHDSYNITVSSTGTKQ
jgi:hypothetical protein